MTYRKAAESALVRVLEDMAMLLTDAIDPSEPGTPPENLLSSSIRFRGEFSGELTLMIPTSVATEAAANWLGLDTDDIDSEEALLDAVGELANVTVGQMLTDVAGADPVFDLDTPRSSAASADAWNDLQGQSDTASVLAEDEEVLVRVEIDN